EDELRAEGRLPDQLRLGSGIILQGQVLGQALQHPDAAIQPVMHAAGGQLTGLFRSECQIVPDGVALQIIVVKREQGECQDDDAAPGEKNLVTEFEFHGRSDVVEITGAGGIPGLSDRDRQEWRKLEAGGTPALKRAGCGYTSSIATAVAS